jgi:hypothetical protein
MLAREAKATTTTGCDKKLSSIKSLEDKQSVRWAVTPSKQSYSSAWQPFWNFHHRHSGGSDGTVCQIQPFSVPEICLGTFAPFNPSDRHSTETDQNFLIGWSITNFDAQRSFNSFPQRLPAMVDDMRRFLSPVERKPI